MLALKFTVFLAVFISAIYGKSFDWSMGNTTVWLSAGAYCETNTYMTRAYKGYSAGFVPTYVLDDKDTDTQGYVGYRSSDSSIYVVYRGSTSISDWVNNLQVTTTDYPKCSGCQVHKGFYNAEQGIISKMLSAVQSLKAKFPSYTVVVTGHSLGAALATLTTLDFMDAGVTPIRMAHYGCPRVGNTEFANWASAKIGDRNRNTHHKDMVPHCPMHERFTHMSGEWYEDPTNKLKECSGNEDSDCSYQWHITSIDDHMYYLGLHMSCDSQ
jgi:hypothetical protein